MVKRKGRAEATDSDVASGQDLALSGGAGRGGHLRYQEINYVLEQLLVIWTDMITSGAASAERLAAIHPDYRDSARNLLYYLALRRHDLRPLQTQLAELGLSSLGRAEAHVLATVEVVLEALHRLAQRPWQLLSQAAAVVDFAKGQGLLAAHTERLLGAADPGRSVRIMVTMPSEAAAEYTLVHALLQQGMNCMRINCAHDDAVMWAQMIANLRRAECALGKSCRIAMDLSGPKLRTGPIEPGPAVARIRPQRDAYGRVTAAARVWLTAEDAPGPPPSPADACLPVSASWLAGLNPGERIRLVDARGARRSFMVKDVIDAGCWVETAKTVYIVPGTTLRHDSGPAKQAARQTAVGGLPAVDASILLQQGDLLMVTGSCKPGRPAVLASDGRILTPARIGCTILDIFESVQSGEAIWFDDGKIGGVIEQVESDHALVRITRARAGGGRLRADKGINLPDSNLQLGAMTDKDCDDLSFIVEHADIVELSFANTADDVAALQQRLEGLGSGLPAIVLKIETRCAFDNLPDMLLTAMRWPCCGVMIARGDLAVECGFERLAEVQEEILCICEAAHIPVIWATQVLENLAKEGIPSRAEITDAAMGHRAEGVMLNKGPHVLSAVRVLDDILRRMHTHQAKKSPMLRELRLAHALTPEPGAAEAA